MGEEPTKASGTPPRSTENIVDAKEYGHALVTHCSALELLMVASDEAELDPASNLQK